jgi:two-component system sensor histidine kinase KdpD
MARLIGNLLEMVRLESGALQVQKEWQSVDELVGMAVLRMEPALEGHELHTAVPPDLPLLQVDGVLIEQVLVNLIENAIKYTPTGSRISITARADQGAMELVVDDNGPGVPAEEREAIFGKFHRVSPVAATGSGLGLTICRGIVMAHGGSIAAESSPMGGLRIVVRLPLPEHQPRIEGESVDT